MAPGSRLKLHFSQDALSLEPAGLPSGFYAVCLLTNAVTEATVLSKLSQLGVKCIALRSTGLVQVDMRRPRSLAYQCAACRTWLQVLPQSMPSR